MVSHGRNHAMKKDILNLLLIITGFANAQQNLFNIHSGDITQKGNLFYQYQLNFYSLNELERKPHLLVGLGNGWDAGLNLVDLPLQINNPISIAYNDDSSRKPLYL